MPECSVCGKDSNKTVDLNGKCICSDCFKCTECCNLFLSFIYSQISL